MNFSREFARFSLIALAILLPIAVGFGVLLFCHPMLVFQGLFKLLGLVLILYAALTLVGLAYALFAQTCAQQKG